MLFVKLNSTSGAQMKSSLLEAMLCNHFCLKSRHAKHEWQTSNHVALGQPAFTPRFYTIHEICKLVFTKQTRVHSHLEENQITRTFTVTEDL